MHQVLLPSHRKGGDADVASCALLCWWPWGHPTPMGASGPQCLFGLEVHHRDIGKKREFESHADTTTYAEQTQRPRETFTPLKEVSAEVTRHPSPGDAVGCLYPQGCVLPLKSNPLKTTLLTEKGRRWKECESLRAGGVSSLLPRAC